MHKRERMHSLVEVTRVTHFDFPWLVSPFASHVYKISIAKMLMYGFIINIIKSLFFFCDVVST